MTSSSCGPAGRCTCSTRPRRRRPARWRSPSTSLPAFPSDAPSPYGVCRGAPADRIDDGRCAPRCRLHPSRTEAGRARPADPVSGAGRFRRRRLPSARLRRRREVPRADLRGRRRQPERHHVQLRPAYARGQLPGSGPDGDPDQGRRQGVPLDHHAEGATAVAELGKVAYSAPTRPEDSAGPGVEIGWLTGDRRLIMLRCHLAPGTASELAARLRERVAASGGTVDVRPLAPGWRLRVQVPTPAENTRPEAAPAPTIGT